MNKAELITAVAQKSGLTRKDADKVVASVLESITETLGLRREGLHRGLWHL